MKIETWTSDKNQEEIHHFAEDTPDLYLFGFNRRLLGEELYRYILRTVEMRLTELEIPR
jgi:hypothetical protein